MEKQACPDLERLPANPDPVRQPQPIAGEPGRCSVDATWGTIQPQELPGGVVTVGELETIDHLRAGGLAIDTRQPAQAATGTLPGAFAIRHQDVVDELPAVDRGGVVLLFCNGPQCAATPKAVANLLEAGYDASRLRYYRGGIHDWVTLGLPTAPPATPPGR